MMIGKKIVQQLLGVMMVLALFASCEKAPENDPIEIPEGESMPIQIIKNEFNGSNQQLPACLIEGVVISDRSTNNFDPKELYLMDGSQSGIKIVFYEPHPFELGDNIKIKAYKLTMVRNSGFTQIIDVPLSRAEKSSQTYKATPNIVSISDLYNYSKYDCSLVRIDNVYLTKEQGNTYAHSVMLSDNLYYGNMITLYTEYDASFANETINTQRVSVTAILTNSGNSYNYSSELRIRDISDISYGITDFHIDFSTFNPLSNSSLGWKTYTDGYYGNWGYANDDFDNQYQVCAYVSSSYYVTDSWLISPVINLEKMDDYILSFKSGRVGDVSGGELEVYLSPNYYTTEDMNQSQWIKLNCNTVSMNSPQRTWINSGDINLSSTTGYGNIAFRVQFPEYNDYNDRRFTIDDLILESRNN